VWAADGGNGRVVDMNSTKTTSAGHLLNMLFGETDLLFPNVDDSVREIVCVQFVATLIELEEKQSKGL